jgi:4-amino-4-deoxy-L-arabinose transferase-like glycosyltransferase
MPYDEMVYRIFSRYILRVGWPVLPDGSIANVNPPLAYYLNAFGMRFVGDNLRAMRMLHLVFYFLPILLITMRMSHKLFGGIARWLVLILFSGLSFIYCEIITVEIDMPFSLISTVLLWLMLERSELIANQQPVKMIDRLVGIAWCSALLMKFAPGVIFAPIILTLLGLEFSYRRRETFRSLLRILSFASLAPLIWLTWYALFGAHLGVTLLHLFKSVVLGDPTSSNSSLVNNNLISYAIFVMVYISIPLFAAIATSLLWHRQSIRSLLTPIVWIIWFLIAMGLSKIQAVRYFDPALPAALLLASGIGSERILRSCSGLKSIWSWSLALLVLFFMLAVEIFSVRQLVFLGHRVELFKFIFLILLPLGLVGSFFSKLRNFSATFLVLLLVGSTYLFSGSEFPVFKINQESWYRAEREKKLGLELQNKIPNAMMLATSSMTVIYYLDRNYLELPLPLTEDYLRSFTKYAPSYVLLDPEQLNSSYAGKVLQGKLKNEYQSIENLSDGFQLYRRL